MRRSSIVQTGTDSKFFQHPGSVGKVSDTSNHSVFIMPARASTQLMDSGLRRNDNV